MSRPSQVTSRARGALLGQAVGDALGTTVEFMGPEAIRAKFPEGLRDVIGGGPFGVLPGQVTDDTELAMALGRSLAQLGTYDEDAVAEAYLAWFQSGPVDFGYTTRVAFGSELPAGPGLAKAVMARANRESEANGALMRASPLGVFGWRLPPAELARLAALDARLSHPHPRCQAANVVFTHAIAHALRTGDDGPKTYAATVAFAAQTPAAQAVLEDLEAAATALPADFVTHEGWVRVAFQAAFHHLAQGTPFEAAVVDVVNRGGDTDTNGCITGALLGAAAGEEAVPERWSVPVLACRPESRWPFTCEGLVALADRLAGG